MFQRMKVTAVTIMTYGMEREVAGKYISYVEQIRRWYDSKSLIPIKDAANFMGLTMPQFEGIITLIEQHPDWDDRTVADNANWRL